VKCPQRGCDFEANGVPLNFAEWVKGREFGFYGVCNNEFKLDDDVWEAIEDPSDGCRSYLGSVKKKDSDGIFFGSPIATVKVLPLDRLANEEAEGFKIVDAADGHVWLEFGTANIGDCYPWFVFTYHPKEACGGKGRGVKTCLHIR
jgi:hypothetical protein